MPDVPTLKGDLGVTTADVALEFWWGLFVPKGTPEPIKAKLQKATQDTMVNPALRERLVQMQPHARLGRADEALKALRDLLKVAPQFRIGMLRRVRFADAKLLEADLALLRTARIPE